MAKNAKNTKKLTIKYWESLEKGSKERALKFCFPTNPAIVDMLLDETPTKEEIKYGFWSIVFKHIREPLPDERGHRFYKTVHLNTTWIP